jgi:prepilin-type N-terminal cleavage/methylation domain-containing protein
MNVLAVLKQTGLLNLRETAAKPGQDLSRRSPSQREGGYTLLELLVVVMLVGVLAAIAGPGWLTFVNRQRINGVRGEVYQTLQLAQSEAKKNKLSRTVAFSSRSTDGLPQVSINGGPPQLLGQGQIKKGQITNFKVTTPTTPPTNSITFDYQGNVDEQNGKSAKTPYIVTVSGPGGKRCVIVQTLLGGMRTANEKDCP